MPIENRKNQEVLDSEFEVGLVLHLDPISLSNDHANVTCGEKGRVEGPHFFVCVAHDQAKKRGLWMPVYSKNGPGRLTIAPAQKSGHPKWTDDLSYAHPGQVWDALDSTVQFAARAGRDASKQHHRNRMLGAADLLVVAAA